nr:MFS transporter [uncultured Moraxella sp.]
MTNASILNLSDTQSYQDGKPLPKSSLLVASFSTIVEWYDFTLYLYFATVLSKVFFGDNPTSIVITLAGFAVSYLMRPLGAMFFGHFGDRFGRRATLLVTMTMMSIAMFLTALLPTFESIGIWSGILMLLLRCVMAFSVGGEYTGVVAYLVEGAKPHKRGFVASLASAFSEIGGLLAVFVSAVTVHFFAEDLLTYGWRLPFIFGAVLALLVLISRHRMAETPEFVKFIQQNQSVHHTSIVAKSNHGVSKENATSPLLLALKYHKPEIAKTFAISALGSITYYVGITFVPVFLVETVKVPQNIALWLSTIASFSVIVITPMIGALSDKIGRKPVLIGACIANMILPIVLFNMMATAHVMMALVGAVVLACLAGAVSAVAASATSEQFATHVRLSGLALGVTLATAVFGGLTPLLAQLFTNATGKAYSAGIMIMVVALCVLPVLMTLKETAPNKQIYS